MAPEREHAEVIRGEIGGIDGPFFAGGADGDDAAERGSGAQEGEQVEDEARAGVVG